LSNGLSCRDYVCNLPEDAWSQFYINRVDSIRYSFGEILVCSKNYIVTILQSIIFIGSLVGNILYPYFTDNYGRKFGLTISWGGFVIGLILLSISWNIYAVGVSFLLIGLGEQSLNLSFIIFDEQV
jgi:MFS family permease